MSTTTTPARYTPEDLLRMPDGDRYELVDGKLVERNMSFWSSYVSGLIHALLSDRCEAHRLGWVVSKGASYQCFPDDPTRVRKPDTSFVRAERLSVSEAQEVGHLPLAPDLAVEVISPNDLYYEVEQRVDEWLRAGVRLVWVVNPRNRRVRICRADGTDATAREDDELTGEEVVPGFRCRVGELFQPPPGAISPA